MYLQWNIYVFVFVVYREDDLVVDDSVSEQINKQHLTEQQL